MLYKSCWNLSAMCMCAPLIRMCGGCMILSDKTSVVLWCVNLAYVGVRQAPGCSVLGTSAIAYK